jgi:hypothetical protein
MSCFGFPNGPSGIERGRVVGKASENIVDNWIVEFQHDFPPMYLYKTIIVPHVFILMEDGA